MRIRNSWITNVTAMVQLLSLILILSVIENMAQHSFLPTAHDRGNVTQLHSAITNNLQNTGGTFVPYPFHEVFSMIGKEGDIQRIHYASDEKGVRANFYSNDVNSPLNYVPSGPQSPIVLPVEENIKASLNLPVNSSFNYIPFGSQPSFLLSAEENIKKTLNSHAVNTPFNYIPTLSQSSIMLPVERNGNKPIRAPANYPAILPYQFPLNYEINIPLHNNNENKPFQEISNWLHPSINHNLRLSKNDDLKNKELSQTQDLSHQSKPHPSLYVNTRGINPVVANKINIIPHIEESNYPISNAVRNTQQNNDVSIDALENAKLKNKIKSNTKELHQDFYRIPKQRETSSQNNKEEKLPKISNSKPKINFSDIYKLTESIDINPFDISYFSLNPKLRNNVLNKPNTISRNDESIIDEQYNTLSPDSKSLNLQSTRGNNYSPTLDASQVPEISEIPYSKSTSDLKKWYLEQLNSPSVSTVFDISNENGRFYHYVLNMVKPVSSLTKNKYFTTGNALLKLLDEAKIPYAHEDITFTQTTKPENGEETLKYDSIKDKSSSKIFIIKSDVGKKIQTRNNKTAIVPKSTRRNSFDKESFNSKIAKNMAQGEIKEAKISKTNIHNSQLLSNAILNKIFATEPTTETSISTVTEEFNTETSPSPATETTTTQNAGTTSMFIEEENTTKSFDLVDSTSPVLKENSTDIESESLFITIKNGGPLNMLMIPVNWLFSSSSDKNDTDKENEVSITNLKNTNETETSTLHFIDSTTSPSPTTSNDNDDSDVTDNNLKSKESITSEIPSTTESPISTTSMFTLINKDLDTTTTEIPTESSTTKSAITSSYDQLKTSVTLDDHPTTIYDAQISKPKEETDILTMSDKDKNNNLTSDSLLQTSAPKSDSKLATESENSILEGKIRNMTNSMIILQVSDMEEFISHINDLPFNLISMIGNIHKSNKSQEKIIHTIAHGSISEKLLNEDKKKTEYVNEKAKASKLSRNSVPKQSSKRKKSSAKRKNDSKKLEVPQFKYSLIHPLFLEHREKSIFNLPHDDTKGNSELFDTFAKDKSVDTLKTFLQKHSYNGKETTDDQPPNAYSKQHSIYRNGFHDVSNKNNPKVKFTAFDKNTMNFRTPESFRLVNDMISHYPLQHNQQQNGIFQTDSFDKTVSDDRESNLQLFNDVPSSFYSISNANPEVIELVERIDIEKNNLNESETDFVDILHNNVYFDVLRLNDTNSINVIPQYEILEYVPIDSFQNNSEISVPKNVEFQNPVIFLDEYSQIDTVKSNVQNELESRNSENIQSENPLIYLDGYANIPIDSVRSERLSKLEHSDTKTMQRENQVIFLEEYANGPTDTVRHNVHRNLINSDSRNVQSDNPVIILENYGNIPATRQQNTINTLTAEIINSDNQFSNINEDANILIVDDASFGIRLQENPSLESPANEQTNKRHSNVRTTGDPGSSSILSRAPWLK